MSFKARVRLAQQTIHIRFILRSLKAFPDSHPAGAKIYKMLSEYSEGILDEDFDGQPIIDLMFQEVCKPLYPEPKTH